MRQVLKINFALLLWVAVIFIIVLFTHSFLEALHCARVSANWSKPVQARSELAMGLGQYVTDFDEHLPLCSNWEKRMTKYLSSTTNLAIEIDGKKPRFAMNRANSGKDVSGDSLSEENNYVFFLSNMNVLSATGGEQDLFKYEGRGWGVSASCRAMRVGSHRVEQFQWE